ncbi:MAG: ABC transporter ATP-binding protein [Chloroflexi bacterium]|nr:MAG: ABC transporter ATP-binding protein [Chloroflexota bacterium]
MRLEIRGVHFNYGSTPALEDVSVEVGEGEVVSLVGPNGSGKTTLLKCINRILSPQRGTILLEKRDVSKVSLKELARLAGYVPQSAARSFPTTVFDTVLLGRKPYLGWAVSARDKDVALNLLRSMGMEDMILRDFNELSGGEKQKVLLARALAQEPAVLLLDEPTSNLDLRHQLEVMDLICSLAKGNGVSAIMAIHDLNLASRYSDRVILLKKGLVYAAGEPGSVLVPENIREVYCIDTIINEDSGKPYIIPLAPCHTSPPAEAVQQG